MLCAMVVLPRPGGPNSRVWSSASPRWRAAEMKISSWLRTFSWPTYSSSCLGRSARSIASSLAEAGVAAMMRCSEKSSVWMLMVGYLCFGQRLERMLDAFRHGRIARHLFQRQRRLLVGITQRQQGVEDIRSCIVMHYATDRTEIGTELALQFEQQAFGGFLADAGHFGETAGFLQGHGLRQIADRHTRQNRQGSPGTNARNLDQFLKRITLFCTAETEQDVGVFANREMRQQYDLLAQTRQIVEGAHGHADFVTDAVAIDQQLRRIFFEQNSGEATDHDGWAER